MMDRKAILRRLDGERQNIQVRRLRSLLEREDTRLLSTAAKISVSEALRLWTTRLKNTDITGQKLDGANLFVSRLKELTPRRKLEQFALVGSEDTGNMFFEVTSGHFVGAVIVKHKKN